MDVRAPLVASLLVLACASARSAVPAGGIVPPGTPDAVDIAAARARGARPLVAWSPWRRAAFERARAEGRFVLVEGAAAWCHWCHVMDAVTYADPAVAERLRDAWVAVRFDVEARPDLAARYAEWGWPALIVLRPDGAEVLRHRGFLRPEALLALLERARTLPPLPPPDAPSDALDDDALATVGPWIAWQLDAAWDPRLGSWGAVQKLSLGDNVRFELARASHGDRDASARVALTLRQQRALYDPIEGGVYQYSAGATWHDPHYEKLMTFQAATLEALSDASTQMRAPQYAADAARIARYMVTVLADGDGAFHPTQDADVNGHDDGAPFVDGRVYHAADLAGRRAFGTPRVDPHVYARDNGLAIAALATHHARCGAPSSLDAARRAAERMAQTHVDGEGRVAHEAASGEVRYLADAAALGRGYATLAEVLPEGLERARFTLLASRVAEGMLRDFATPSGALAARTADPDAPASLTTSDTPEGDNVLAARFLAGLARVTGTARWREAARRILAVMATPAHAAARGRFVGDLLMALDEAGEFPWWAATPGSSSRQVEHARLTAISDGGLLRLALVADGTLHVNTRYPLTVHFEALDAEAPAPRALSDAVAVGDDAVRFEVPLRVTGPRPTVRATWRFALCGAESCQAETRRIVVTGGSGFR